MKNQSIKSNRKKNISLVLVAAIVLIWLLIGAGFFGAWLVGHLSQKSQIKEAQFDGNQVVTSEESDISKLANQVSRSVVSIVTTKTAGSGWLEREMQGAGTGIIISSDGYILTNKHVVSGARAAQVVLSDGTRYEGVDLIGADPLNDLAFLKIRDVKDLTAATIGDSGTARVGQRVIAIGNSLGQYQNTVTSGIISGLGRPIVAALDSSGANVESLTDLLQTDAAINQGNSGGPLINMAGQVIGINTAIVSNAQSIGFAIPINASKGMIRGVLKDGKVKRAYLGVNYVAITPDVRAEYDLSEKQGALIRPGRGGQSAVLKGGPSDKAGLKDGDIITGINDKKVGQHGSLGSLAAEFLPGEKITVTYVRDSKTQTAELTLAVYSPES